MDKEMLEKLDERLAKGEISEELYHEIKARYEKEEGPYEGEEEDEVEQFEEVEKKGIKKTKRVSLSGASSIDGCNCKYFSSSGASKINGEFRADDADVSGATKVTGDAHIGELDSSGAFKVKGKTKADHMDLSGNSKFMGPVESKKIDSSGATKFLDNVKVKNMNTSGSFKAEKNITAKNFASSGVFSIGETLKSEQIMLDLGGKCSIKHIRGGDIMIESGGSSLFSFGRGGKLICESIKGDEIYLENTSADLVEGKTVKIGPGCKIDTVKADKLSVHESSTVKNRSEGGK